MNGEYIINFSTREVISLNGLTVRGTTYYMLEQVRPNYNIQYVNPATTAPSFDIETQYLEESCRIKITNIVFSGYASIETGILTYKLHSSQEWVRAPNNRFEVYAPGIYDVKLTDNSGNSTTKNAYVYSFANLNIYLDGINNTRSGNSTTSTTWEDLSQNQNDAIGYNMNTANGYYSTTEKGYVFLENSSYFETINNIGISGDPIFTVEVVMKPYSDPPAESNVPLWWGSLLVEADKTIVIGYYATNLKFLYSYINNTGTSNNTYTCVNNTLYYAVKKVRTGVISTGNTDMYRMNYNGTSIGSTYNGSASITANLAESKLYVGRDWQYNNINRPFYGVIKAIRIYNRALTDEELSVNANIDSQRFGFNL